MANNLSIYGTIERLLPMESGFGKQSGKPWSRQMYILKTIEQYPKTIAFTVYNDKVNQFAIKPGETLTAHINIESREFQGRWYTAVEAWRIEREGYDATADTPQATPQAGQTYAPQATPQGASPTAQPTQPIPSNTPTMPSGATMQAQQNDLPF